MGSNGKQLIDEAENHKTESGEKGVESGEEDVRFGEKRERFGEFSSQFGKKVATFGENPAQFGEKAATFGEDSAQFGEKAATFGENSAQFGEKAATFGEDPVQFGEKAATFGEDSAQFGEKAATFGENPVQFSEKLPISHHNSVHTNQYRQTELGPIPNDWTMAELKKIADPDHVHSFADGDWIESKNQAAEGIRLIQTGNIGVGRFIDHESKKYISEKTFDELNCKEVFEGDLLICRLADPIGRSCMVPKLETRAITSVDVAILRPDTSRYHPEYVNYYMNSSKTLQRIHAFSSGSTRQRISRSHLGDIRLAFPPLDEQRKIAEILLSVDKAIKQAQKIYEQTETVKNGLMQQLLIKGVGHKEFKKSPIGVIPVHWKVGMLGDFLTDKPQYGANASAVSYSETMPRYIRITDITADGFLNDNDLKSIPLKGNEKYMLHDGDFLIARTGNTVGKSYLYHDADGQAIYAGYLIRFKLDQKQLLPSYLFHVTHSSYYYNWVKSTIRTGAQPNINAQEYSSLLMTVPPVEEQRQIVSILDTFTQKLNAEKERIDKLENMKHGLMQALLTGGLRVK